MSRSSEVSLGEVPWGVESSHNGPSFSEPLFRVSHSSPRSGRTDTPTVRVAPGTEERVLRAREDSRIVGPESSFDRRVRELDVASGTGDREVGPYSGRRERWSADWHASRSPSRHNRSATIAPDVWRHDPHSCLTRCDP